MKMCKSYISEVVFLKITDIIASKWV